MKQNRICILITILIFIFCTCLTIFQETHRFYDGLTDTTNTSFKPAAAVLTNTSGLNHMIAKSADAFDYDEFEVTDVTPAYLQNSESLHFYECLYIKNLEEGLDCTQALFLRYQGHLINPGYPERTNYNPDSYTVHFQSAAVISLDNTARPEIFFTCTYNGFKFLCIVDTATFQAQWIDCEYYFYERSEQEDWLITIHDSGIRQKDYISLRLCIQDNDSESFCYKPSEVIGTIHYTNNGYILQKEPAYIYQPDNDTLQFLRFMLDNHYIKKDSEKYFAYLQLLTNLKRYCPEASAEDLFFVYLMDYREQDSDTYDMHIYHRSPDDEDAKNLEKDLAFIRNYLSMQSEDAYKNTVNDLIMEHR